MSASQNKYGFIKTELRNRRKLSRFRRLRQAAPLSGPEIRVDGKALTNFCNNDYLGLSQHPLVKQRAAEYIAAYGAGSTASRLICGNIEAFARIEEKLAGLKKNPAALLFSTGFQANVSIIPALADRQTLICSDRLNHNSLIQGIRLARCQVRVYRHNDTAHLEEILQAHQGQGFSRILIVAESVFSMDGDRSDLDALEALAEAYEALLVVDDAHATGVLGDRGMGLTAGRQMDAAIGTFGKAAGSFGAYLSGSRELKEYMINCCSGLIYSTALPPAVLGAVDAALELIPGMEKERRELQEKAAWLRGRLHENGWETTDSTTQIVPVIAGSEENVLELSRFLEENGILATAIRPPTVPEGSARIRISLTALHSWAHLEKLVAAFAGWAGRR